MLRLFLAAMLLGGAIFFLSAQNPAAHADFNPRFEIFTLPGGEAANQVQCIVQDSIGFLWFGSTDGLHRYDGQHIITYHNDPLDNTSIASDQVEWIFVDQKGILWLGHWGKGISVFNPATGRCTRYSQNPGNPHSLSNNNVSMILEDRAGFIWIATAEGLNRLDPKTGLFKHFFHSSSDPASLSYDFVRSLYVDKSGVLWVGCGSPFDENDSTGTLGGLNRYHPENGTFTRYLHHPKSSSSLSGNRVRAMYEDKKGNFWVGTGGDGLQLVDRNTGRFTRLPFDVAHPARLSSPVLHKNEVRFPPFYHVTFISEDQMGSLWIGAVEGGLNVYDPEAATMQHFEQAAGMTDSLQTNSLWHFCQTRDGVVWLASGGIGGKVFRVKNTNNLFPYFNAGQLGLEHATFPGVAKDSAGGIWLQVRGSFSGIVRFEPESGQWRRFPYVPANVTRSFLDFEELEIDGQGTIWASTPQGLYKMTPEGTARSFQPDAIVAQRIDFKILWPPFFDGKGNTWIAAWGDGLYCLSPKMELTHFRHDSADPGSIGGNQVEKVFEDHKGNIVVHGGSINVDTEHPMFFDRFEPGPSGGNGAFKHLLPPGEMGDPCRAVEDKNGNFWFVAFPYGIRKLNPETGAYKSYTAENGNLANNCITDMVMGQDGHIWMTAAGYIIELDPESELFYTYSAHHGVQNLAWTWVTGSCAGHDGAIIFSGEGGFHAFYPNGIHRKWQNKPTTLRLTGFKIFGKEVVPNSDSILSRPIWETREIRLKHDLNVFSFHISCFDFYGPELSRIEFMLENYDRGWRNELREGEAGYVNIPPGTYIFRARGANSMGIWGQEISLRVVVLPPWWQTWSAYLIYTLLLAGGLYTFYRLLLNRRLEHAETLRLQELDAVKTKLYTNITHEFRTPLTVILGMARQVLADPKEHFRYGLEMIVRNGQNLLALVNQMLDLNKLESGKLSLHLQQGDAVNFLKYLVESCHSLAESKGVRIHFLDDVEALTMDFDAERLQQVVSNLLSNAVKFTPEGGHVYFSVGCDSGMQTLVIKIKDTGIGISEEHLPHIFDRFYQADDPYTRQGEGTGIGLALAKELVRLMEGDIAVRSTQGKGTEFVVTLPIRRAAGLKISDGKEWTSKARRTPPPSSPIAHQLSVEKPLVLIAEDNEDVVTFLASCLAVDYRLAVAKNGLECEEIAFDIIPDLIITDVMMPAKDGFEVCETLKKDERTSHIPIIILTAKADTDSKLAGLERGADVYLMKPFLREELLVRIKKLLELRQQLQRHYLALAGMTGSDVVEKDMPPLSNAENTFVTKARAAVEAHLDDFDFTVDQLCRVLLMSHSQVHRKISALTGLSANKFIRFIRLSKAKTLLMNPDKSITEVAFDSGFSDPSYFGKVFKQAFGVTPMEWREGSLPNKRT